MDSMAANKEQTNKVMEKAGDVKIVTIDGKQLEIKYEYRRKRVDIFGLHSGNRRSGNENRRPAKSYSPRNYKSDGIRNIGHRRQSDDRLSSNIVTNNESNTNSIDSKEGSIIESVKGLSKVDKLVQKLETYNETLNKKNSSIERVANKLKEDKEPVKMTNRFDRLLSSVNAEDFNTRSVDKISAKKNRRKKRKSSVNSFDVKFEDSPNQSENQNTIVAQNDSEVVSSDSVSNTIDSNDFIPKSDYIFENNNNLNYFEKSDDKLIKLNENKEKDEKPQNFKVYKNPIRQNTDLLINEFIDEFEVSDNEDIKQNQYFDIPGPQKEETVGGKVSTYDFDAIKVEKNVLIKPSNNYSKYVPTLRHKSTKDSKFKVKSNLMEQQVTKETNVSVVDQKSSAIKWLFIISSFVAFLVIYTSIILNRFCDCS